VGAAVGAQVGDGAGAGGAIHTQSATSSTSPRNLEPARRREKAPPDPRYATSEPLADPFRLLTGAGRIDYIWHAFIAQSTRLSKELGDYGRLFRRTGSYEGLGKKVRTKRGV
jgi:hypothetical protein